jgi:hypothetical protein
MFDGLLHQTLALLSSVLDLCARILVAETAHLLNTTIAAEAAVTTIAMFAPLMVGAGVADIEMTAEVAEDTVVEVVEVVMTDTPVGEDFATSVATQTCTKACAIPEDTTTTEVESNNPLPVDMTRVAHR